MTAAPALKAAPLAAAVATPYPTGINPAVDMNLPNWANSPNIRKFVDSLPGLGPTHVNNLGQYVSVAVPDTTSYPGSDYYEIALVRYSLKMHTDLPATDLRGYVQLETPANVAPANAPPSKHIALTYPTTPPTPILNAAGQQVYAYDNPQYLGTSIVATKNRPVRIKFTNYLPKDAGGDLPLPVDTTIMGAGMGNLPMPGMPTMMESYTQNRATLHLHGGLTPWISDGTPHQWITPAGALAPGGMSVSQYQRGAVATNVSDMPDPGPGSLTFYYTNGQSARLLFYHDHAYGITRLNVYAGEAAGYLITDPTEQGLITSGLLPTLGGDYPLGIPLVIQDKTFVNDPLTTPPGAGFTGTPTSSTLLADPLWYKYVPGTHGGNFWIGHEYLPNENIYNDTGFNDKGRWDYGPWMNPPMVVRNNTLPSPTIIPEAFMDTMIVNGTALPFVQLPPTLVRFRILNACNDRMLNLQLYKADPAGFTVKDTNNGTWSTEVKMVDACPTVGFPASWPKDGRDGGVPDPATAGPDWWQIGNESGLLAQVNVVPAQPVDYDYNRRSVTFGSVTSKSLQLPPAVRADVIVDLSKYKPGDTVILYNDNPAPMPLYDTRYDYYTGCPDQRSIGGSPTIPAGFGPNTRTIMQIRITTASTTLPPVPANYLASLQAAIPKAFVAAQEKPIVNEAVFNTAYGTTYGNNFMNVVDESLNVSGAAQQVAKIVTTLPGLAYATPPTVGIYGGNGTGATAKAGLNPVGGVTLLTGGSGYTTPPAVTIGPPALPLAASPAAFNGLTNGVQATAVATISGGVVTAITITEPGAGYTNIVTAPTITIAPPTGVGGVAATAQVMLPTLNTVGSIVLVTPGSGYTKAPYVYLTGGGGTGATASAMLVGDMVPTMKNLIEGMDMDYGRMNAVLGSTPNILTPTVGAGPVVGATMYIDPPTEILDTDVPALWRVTHIGVDSHALHFHLFDVQVINRVDWTNTLKPPYPEEIGWKDTIRTNPFEDIIIALRPKVSNMKLPFGIPDSVRLLDVTAPLNSAAPFNPVPPPVGVPAVAQITNVMTNFGWEYVYHCHLLGHEENDMMRPVVCNVPRSLPTPGVLSGATAIGVNLTWTDTTPWNGTGPSTTQGNPANEIGFIVERATLTGNPTVIANLPANTTAYNDRTGINAGTQYRYRVTPYNVAGNGTPTNIVTVVAGTMPPAAPSLLTASILAGPQVRLSWNDNATNETGFVVERSDNGGPFAQIAAPGAHAGTGATLYTNTTVVVGSTYSYRVKAVNSAGSSAYSNTVVISLALPAAPTALTFVSATRNSLTFNWTDNANNETGFYAERSTAGATGPWTRIATLAANTVAATNTGLTPARTYWYRVQAYNAVGVSTFAGPTSGTTLP